MAVNGPLPGSYQEAKKQGLHNEMVAASEKSEASEASEKSVEKGEVMTKSFVVNAWFKRAMSHN